MKFNDAGQRHEKGDTRKREDAVGRCGDGGGDGKRWAQGGLGDDNKKWD